MAEKGENLHDVILRLAEELGPTVSFDASLVAREMWPAKPDEVKGEERWRKLIRPVRSAAIGLARQGEIELLRRGDVIDPHKFSRVCTKCGCLSGLSWRSKTLPSTRSRTNLVSSQGSDFFAQGAKLRQDGLLSGVRHFVRALAHFFFVLQRVHGVHDDTNEQVERGKGAQDDISDEIDCGCWSGMDVHDGPNDPVAPTFQRHDLEECVGGAAKVAEIVVTVCVAAVYRAPEHMHTDDGKHIVNERKQYHGREHARQGVNQTADDRAHAGDHRQQPQCAHDPQGTESR